jgi:hypothetical protein
MEDNIVATLPGAQHRSFARTFGISTGTTVNDNTQLDFRGRTEALDQLLPAWAWSDLRPSIAGLVGSRNDSREWRARPTSAAAFAEPVPEPATWLMLGIGFALIGRHLRAPRPGQHRLPVQLA